ncbi:hypothetical protein GR255_20785 [Mycobacterium tuberculosis]|nr:hypothetical protein [Mycobacterium tuberculosis]
MDNVRKEGRWAKKRRLRREEEERDKEEKAEYRDIGRLKIQSMYKAGFGRSRASDKLKRHDF